MREAGRKKIRLHFLSLIFHSSGMKETSHRFWIHTDVLIRFHLESVLSAFICGVFPAAGAVERGKAAPPVETIADAQP